MLRAKLRSTRTIALLIIATLSALCCAAAYVGIRQRALRRESDMISSVKRELDGASSIEVVWTAPNGKAHTLRRIASKERIDNIAREYSQVGPIRHLSVIAASDVVSVIVPPRTDPLFSIIYSGCYMMLADNAPGGYIVVAVPKSFRDAIIDCPPDECAFIERDN